MTPNCHLMPCSASHADTTYYENVTSPQSRRNRWRPHSPSRILTIPLRRRLSTNPNSTTVLSLFWIRGHIRVGNGGYFKSRILPWSSLPARLSGMALQPKSRLSLFPGSRFGWFLVAQIKRWHDMDKSGLWCLVNLIPILGNTYALIELGFQRGTEGPNDYGDDPSCS